MVTVMIALLSQYYKIKIKIVNNARSCYYNYDCHVVTNPKNLDTGYEPFIKILNSIELF